MTHKIAGNKLIKRIFRPEGWKGQTYYVPVEEIIQSTPHPGDETSSSWHIQHEIISSYLGFIVGCLLPSKYLPPKSALFASVYYLQVELLLACPKHLGTSQPPWMTTCGIW